MSTIFNISNKIKLENTPQPLLLNYYGGAAAAYSLRQLDYNYTDAAIRVRRDSDNTEQDISFVNGELDTASLLDFANEEVLKLQSNYSGSTPSPGAATSDLTVSSNQSIAGVNEALKCTVTGTSAPYFYSSGIGAKGNNIRISFDYYIPSGQSLDSIRVGAGTPEQNFTTTGQWATATFEQLQSYTFIIFRANSAAVNDEFYIKNLTITRITSDALVTTWYDQSGNGNNATQTTATVQPKIVSLGSTITDNGKPTIEFNNQGFVTSLAGSPVFDFYAVTKTNAADDYIFPDNNSFGGNYYGYIARSDTSTTIYSEYGSPSLYVNGSLENPIIRSDVKQLISTGSELMQVHQGADTSSWSYIELFNRTGFEFNGTSKEVIIYNTDQSSNRTGIETNINDFYSIY